MGREVRRVPADWRHPKNEYGKYVPMYDTPFADAFEQWKRDDLPEWLAGREKWAEGLVTDYKGGWEAVDAKYAGVAWERYAGTSPVSPDPDHYMPDWPEAERTHFMMYEGTSEGTPISPAFTTPEALARWLADSGASSFGDMTASYEAWLRIAKGGWAPSAIMENGTFKSGVEALASEPLT